MRTSLVRWWLGKIERVDKFADLDGRTVEVYGWERGAYGLRSQRA